MRPEQRLIFEKGKMGTSTRPCPGHQLGHFNKRQPSVAEMLAYSDYLSLSIWVICQKCQCEVKEKGGKDCSFSRRLRNPEDMHCKQADSAIETFIGPSFNGTNIFDHIKQAYVVIMRCCRNMGYVLLTCVCRKSRFVANTRFFGFILSRLFVRHWGFYSDFVQISEQKIGD